MCAAGKVMVLEALLKSIRAAEPTDKVVLVSNYTGEPALYCMCVRSVWRQAASESYSAVLTVLGWPIITFACPS